MAKSMVSGVKKTHFNPITMGSCVNFLFSMFNLKNGDKNNPDLQDNEQQMT